MTYYWSTVVTIALSCTVFWVIWRRIISWPRRNFVKVFDADKTRMNGIRYGEKLWQYVKPFSSNTGTLRTDRWTDRTATSISCVSVLKCDKNHVVSLYQSATELVQTTDSSSFSSRMRVVNHNWSARKQRLYPQSVAEISRHSVLSGDRIRQCGTSSGSHHNYWLKLYHMCTVYPLSNNHSVLYTTTCSMWPDSTYSAGITDSTASAPVYTWNL